MADSISSGLDDELRSAIVSKLASDLPNGYVIEANNDESATAENDDCTVESTSSGNYYYLIAFKYTSGYDNEKINEIGAMNDTSKGASSYLAYKTNSSGLTTLGNASGDVIHVKLKIVVDSTNVV